MWAVGVSPARWLLVLLAASVLACATARNYLDPDQPLYEGSFAAPRRGGATTEIRVVTFNVEKGRHVGGATELLRDHPQLAGADVVLLQEMQAPGVAEIARALGLNYVYYPASHHTKQERDIGNAILTPWPIEERWKVVLPHLSRFSRHARSVVAARVGVGSRRVRVYGLHIGTPINLSGTQRREQLAAVVADARDSPDPVVIAGDFNGRSMAEWLGGKGFEWPTRDVGRTTTLFSSSFDHVLVRGLTGAEGTSAGVVRSAAGVSDHYPVWVRLRLDGGDATPAGPR
jgi:endonuclease/exonuclease/phosphatase family metal-dependent hydrolase